MIQYQEFVGNKKVWAIKEAKSLIDKIFELNIRELDNIDHPFILTKNEYIFIEKYEKELHEYVQEFGWDFRLSGIYSAISGPSYRVQHVDHYITFSEKNE